MDRLIYTLLTGMRARVAAQAVTANNLANAGVTGFRRELSSLASRYLGDDGGRVQATDRETTASLLPGRIAATGQPLDVAVQGAGWLAVQATDGGEAYTRRGDLHVAATGILETGDGLAVIGNAGPISIPAGGIPAIGADGSVGVQLAGQPEPLVIDRIKLVDPPPASLRKGGDGLFRTPEPADASAGVRLQTGALEGANVDTAAGLVELIEQSRGFDVNAKLLGIVRDLDSSAAALMRVDN